MRLKIYIPKQLTDTALVSGSAIVSTGEPLPSSPELIRGYFEGNLYGLSEMKSFRTRALHAAGRLVTKYPTVAIGSFDPDTLYQVGEMECLENGSVQWIAIFEDMKSLLDTWCQGSDLEESGVSYEQDFGSNPLGNGKFVMVPSGKIVSLTERNEILQRFQKQSPPSEYMICNRTKQQIQLLQGGELK